MCTKSKEPPSTVVVMLRRRMCRDFEWISCEDERWNGYANDYSGGSPKPKRVLITVALVTGKAVVEVLSPDYGFDVLI
jgi:hypothetical protein